MKYRILLFSLFFWPMILTQLGCTLPRALWPQEDTPSSEVTGLAAAHHVLVASRQSEFKDSLVARLKEALPSQGVSLRIVGIKQLGGVNAADYSAVVLIGTCIAWGLDPDIQAFLDRHARQENIIVVTTSGRGKWLPEKRDHQFDAVAAASAPVTVDSVAHDILTRVRARIESN